MVLLSDTEKNKNNIYEVFKEAESAKVDINNSIVRWIELYDGKQYGNEIDGKSKIVWKLIKKQSKTLISNLTKSLLGSSQIVQLEPMTVNDIIKYNIDEKLINFFYDHLPDKVNTIKTLVNVVVKEGTVVVKVGWKKVQNKQYIQIPDNEIVNEEELQANGIFKDEKGYFIKNTKYNKPILNIIPNEDIFPDPLATSAHKLRYLFIRQETTIEELKSNPILDNEKIDKWYDTYKNAKFSESANGDDIHDRDLWRVDTEENSKTVEKKMFLYEYWYKKKNKIFVKYVMFVGSEEHILAEKEIDCKEFPYVFINLEINEFSLWGDSLASMIEDEQKFMTSLVRGVVDNISNSNNGQKFIKKGSLDPVNYNRMMSNEPVVEVNTTAKLTDVMVDGSYNELPQSIYNMLNIIENQSEGLTGINQQMQGVSSNIDAPASNFGSMLTQSQIRLNDFMINIQDGLKKIFMKWLKMSMKYLSDEEIFNITGISFADAKWNKFQELRAKYITPEIEQKLDLKAKIEETISKTVDDMFDKSTVEYDIKFRIGTDGLTQIKINQINMLMQQLGSLAQTEQLPPSVIPSLIGKMSELLGFPEIAKEIKEYSPQPDPVQQQMVQLQMQELQAKTMKEQALAENAKARSQNIMVKTQKDGYKTQFDIAGQVADIKKKEAEYIKTLSEAKAMDGKTKESFSKALKNMNDINNDKRNK